ncbi:MAG: TonB-dependent receptor [Bdellovibrionaceae bacterium]|nr:TonB-dependent receptor [Pseudobdellovibrionaceae bacterium]
MLRLKPLFFLFPLLTFIFTLISEWNSQAQAEISWTYSDDNKNNDRYSAEKRTSPGSSASWSSQDIQQLGLSPLTSTKLIPSLQVQGSEMAGPPATVFLRGSPSDEVLILWNGLELNDPSTSGGGASPLQIQREFSHQVRLSQGPSTLLEGSRALAGVLDWRRSSAVSSRVVLGGGTLENQTGLLEFQKRKAKDSIAWGLGVSQNRQQGLSVSSSPPPEKDAQNLTTSSAFLEWPVTSILQLDFLAMLSSLEQEDDLFGAQAKLARSSSRLQGGRFGVDLKISEQDSLRFNYQNLQSARENRNDPVPDPQGYLDKSWGERTKEDITWTHLGSGSSPIDFRFHADTVEELMSGQSQSGAFPTTTFDRYQLTRGVAAVGSTRKKNTQAGFRIDQFDSTPEQRDSVVGWQLQHRWLEGWMQSNFGLQPFVGVSEGHRFPTLFQRFSPFGSQDLKTQVLRAYEVGIEGTATVDWKMTAFRNDYSKMIDFDFVTNKFQNRGKVQTQGIEAEISMESNSDRWLVGLVYLSAKDLILEQRLLRRPHYSSSGFWMHRFSDQWSSTWSLRWMDSRPDFLGPSTTTVLPPSWQSDLNFQFHQQSLLVWNFYLKNLFNSNSEEVATYTVPPRSAFVSVEYSF